MIQPCLNFDTGSALIVGAWSPEPTYLYGAARRPKEGGRNLQADHWAHSAPLVATPESAVPPPPPSEPPVTTPEGTDKGRQVGKKEDVDKIDPAPKKGAATAKPENGDI